MAVVYSQVKEYNAGNLLYIDNNEVKFLKTQEIFQNIFVKSKELQGQDTVSVDLVKINELQIELQSLELAYQEGIKVLELVDPTPAVSVDKNKELQKQLREYYHYLQNYQQLLDDSLFIDEIFIEMQYDINNFLSEINTKVIKVTNISEITVLRQAYVNKVNKILEYDLKLINIKVHTETLTKLKLLSDWIKQTSKFLQEYANILQEFEQALTSNSQIILDNVNVQAGQFNLNYQNAKKEFNKNFNNEQLQINNVLTTTSEDISQKQAEIRDLFYDLKKQFQ